MKKNIISGIQPTNSLTIGNYLGVIKNYQKFQNNDNLMIFIADLHTITNPTLKSSEILEYKKSLVCMLLASGINIEHTKIFYQSDILEHTNLAHVLLCHTTIGELNRMTQFKDKSKKFSASNGTEYIPTGIFTYPTLMAADILLYNTDAVIIGKDQKQHLELTRNIAIRMNKKYHNNLFKIPEALIEECGSRIMDLLQPEIKMSKSNPTQKGVIKLLDNPKDAYKKVMSAKTDNLNSINYDLNKQPGISNLLEIYSSLKNQTIKQTLNEVQKMSYGEFKKIIANEVEKLLIKLQTKYKNYYENFSNIQKKLLENAKNMKKIAAKNLKKVYLAIGITS